MSDKVITSSIIGSVILAILSGLGYIAIMAFAPFPEPADLASHPVGPDTYFQQATLAVFLSWAIVGSLSIIFISTFIAGWWGTKADEPSAHGAMSGLIISVGAILIIGFFLRNWFVCAYCPFVGSLGTFAGLLGSGCGHMYHILKRRIFRSTKDVS